MTDVETDVAMVLALARKNIPPDIQELLLFGNPMRGIPPGALRASFEAALAALNEAGYVVMERKAVLDVIEPYTRVSPLHNYGPGGLSRVEKAEIDTGTMIFQDMNAMLSAAQPAPK